MIKQTVIMLFLLVPLMYSCETGNTNGNTISISLDDVVSVTADIIYIDANCSFDSKSYIGKYEDLLQAFNFSSINGCTDVSGTDVQLFTCVGSLTGTFNSVAVTCSLGMLDGVCVCDAPSGSSADQITTAQAISIGVETLITKAQSAKDSIFNNPNLCTEQAGGSSTDHVCPCNQI
jgi:hypothetical protein